MPAYEVSTTTGSSSTKASSGATGMVLAKASKPKSVAQVFEQTRLLFCTLVLLSQNVKVPTDDGSSDGKVWVTLLPVFVYLDVFFDGRLVSGNECRSLDPHS